MAIAAALLALLLGSAPAFAQVLHIHDTSNRLGTVDIGTGAVSIIGTMGGDVMTDIAFDPTGNLFGLSFTNLYRINPFTAAVTPIGAHGVPGGNALVFGTDGTLYAAGTSSTNLYTLSTTTGSSTLLGNVGFASAGDLAFNGGTNSLFLSATTNQLVAINLGGPISGTAVGPFGFSSVFGLATADNGILYGVAGTSIFSVNTATGTGTLVRNYGGSGLTAANGTSFFTEAGAGTVVPEPSTLTLFGLGAAGLLALARRRRDTA
jgi:hypothetical protein